MAIAAPMIADPRDQHLGTLSFSSTHAKDQFQEMIRQAFDATDGGSVTIMLHLNTKQGPVLLQMMANVVHTESDAAVILTGRELDSGLAGLIHNAETATQSEPESILESTISSLTMPSVFAEPSMGESNKGSTISSTTMPSGSGW